MKQKSSSAKILDQALEIPVIPIIYQVNIQYSICNIQYSIFLPSLSLPAFLGEVVVLVVVGWDGSDSSKSWPWKIRAQTLADHNSVQLLCTMLCGQKKHSKLNLRSWSLGLREAFEVSAASSQSSVMLGQRRHLTCQTQKHTTTEWHHIRFPINCNPFFSYNIMIFSQKICFCLTIDIKFDPCSFDQIGKAGKGLRD